MVPHNLDHQSYQLLMQIAKKMRELNHPHLDQLTPEMSRFFYEKARMYYTPILQKRVQIHEYVIGKDSIPIRVYCPEGTNPLPVLVYMHGGGWVFGSLDSSESFCKYIANQSRCIVVSVGYRLAPEYKYPTALFDSIDAVLWTMKHIQKFSGDIKRMHIGGESSGANLAASACIALHRKIPIESQFLINPVTNYAFNTHSYLENHQFNLTAEKMKWFWGHYLESPENGKEPFASPLRVKNKVASNLPPALIATVEYDPLRSEGEAFASKLKQNGVSVTHLHYNRLVHSFINMIGNVQIAKNATDDMLRHFNRQIHRKQCDTK